MWFHMIRPLANGIVFGCGSMLGTVLMRYYVLDRLGWCSYEKF